MTYWSPDSGPYLWHEFDRPQVARDLQAMGAQGIDVVSVQLPWDAFMPTPQQVPPARLRDVESFLTLADAAGVRVIPVLFAQAFGDCVMLPPYAIDVSSPRRGVRVLTDAVVQPGGPRDQYTDPRMLDAALTWMEQMLNAFAGHSGLHSWCFGHDPGAVMRPRRIAHIVGWVQTLSERVHERGELCGIRLSSDDVIVGRAVRPGMLAPHLDWIGCAVSTRSLPRELHDEELSTLFLAQLLQRMLESRAHLAMVLDVPDATRDPAAVRRAARAGLEQAVAAGAVSVGAPLWIGAGARASAVAPLDTEPWRAQRALMAPGGDPTVFGEAFFDATSREWEERPPDAWPPHLDVEDMYRNLPESIVDLFSTWKDGERDIPARLV